MEVTLHQVLSAKSTFESLSRQKLPAKTSFRIAYMIDSLNPVLGRISEAMKGLFEKYAVKGNGDAKQIPPDKIKEYEAESMDLFSEKISIETMPLTLDLFERAEITPLEASSLMPFMEKNNDLNPCRDK